MTLVMSRADRAAFLAEVHLGVITVGATESPAPLPAPIWYGVDTEGRVRVITESKSQKAAAIEATGRFGIVAHEEQRPFRYVSVEGPVVERRPCDSERDLLPMAVRYLGPDAGRAYTDQWLTWGHTDIVYVMRPQRWGSADHSEVFIKLPGWTL